MAAPAILWLEEVDRTSTPLAGGKGANLGEMKRRGLPVPGGFVLSAESYRRALEGAPIQQLIRARLAQVNWSAHASVERACEEIRRAVLALPMEAEEALIAAHTRLMARHPGWQWVAVRSSGTAEDLQQASFAGQHGTYYYVGRDQLARQVRNCWASLWSPQALLYRHAHQIDHLEASMAVVVQLLVPAEVSGVTFTVNPVTGHAEEMVIEASWGLGAAIVDGKVTPDRFVVEKGSRAVKQRRLAEKQFMVPPPDGQVPDHRLIHVPWSKRLVWTLDDRRLRTVSDEAVRVEQVYGKPQDIEWAFAADGFYLLQARPITTLAAVQDRKPPEGTVWLQVKPIIENFTDPISPMMQSLVDRIPPLCWGFKFHYGRLYGNLNLLRKLFYQSDATWEELARALDLNPTDTRPKAKASRWKLLLWSPLLLLQGVVTSVPLLWLWHAPDDAFDSVRQRVKAIEQDPKVGPEQTRRSLVVVPRLDSPVLGNWISAVASMVLHGLLHQVLRRWAPQVSPAALALATTSEKGVLSAETGKRIGELAREAYSSDEVRKMLLDTPETEIETRLETIASGREFKRKVDEFLAFCGHRGFKEIDLKNKRWVEEPAAVYGMIRNHLSQPLDLEAREQRNARAHAEAHAEVMRYLEGRFFRQRVVRWLIERTAYFSKLRENTRFYWVMALFAIRRKLLALEREWRNKGWLKCEDDIFFLRLEELRRVRSGRLRGEELELLIATRRRQYATDMKLTPPQLLGFEPEAASGGKTLQGSCASPGQHVGRARVILNPAVNCRLEHGEVLVAPYTDPAWTPLFLQAGAVVVEVGSFLSHAGTVAREYGLPAVVDVRDCTSLIRDGQTVSVDADHGLVTLKENPESTAPL